MLKFRNADIASPEAREREIPSQPAELISAGWSLTSFWIMVSLRRDATRARTSKTKKYRTIQLSITANVNQIDNLTKAI